MMRGFKIDQRQALMGLLLLAIVSLAAYSRLSHLDIVEFKNDEAWTSAKAVAVLEGKDLPLSGAVSSLGAAQGPAMIYLMTLPYAFTRDPALATGFIGLLGVLAVLACYRFTSRYFGVPAALASSLLFAASPWAVMYSRKIWEPNPLPFFVILFMSSLLGYIHERRNSQLALAFFWAALLPQFHLAAAVFWVVLGLALVLQREHLRPRPLGAGLLLFALVIAPYVTSNLAQRGRDLGILARQTSAPGVLDSQAVSWALDTVATPGAYAAVEPAGRFLYRAEGVLFACALVYGIVRLALALRARRIEQVAALGLLLVWLVLPVALFSYHSAPVSAHYLLLLYPAQFIWIGIFVGDVGRKVGRLGQSHRGTLGSSMPRVAQVALVALLLAIAGRQVIDVASFLESVRQGKFDDEYGLPLKNMVKAVDLAGASGVAGADHPIVRVAGKQDNFAKPFQYLSGRRFDVEYVDGRAPLVLPANGQFIYAAMSDYSPTARLLDAAFPEGWLGPARSDDAVWGVYPIDASVTDRVLQTAALNTSPHAFPNGVELLGWRAPRIATAGEGLTLTLAWRLPRAGQIVPDGYSFFAHVVDSQSRRWGGLDATPHMPNQPERGDTVVSWYSLPVSAEAGLAQYWVAFGINHVSPARQDGDLKSARLLLGPIKVISKEGLPGQTDALVQTRQHVALADQVELLGYDLISEQAHPGGYIQLNMHWMAVAPDSDYTVFAHLVDQTGKIVAQTDSQPHGGSYPTAMWDRGEYVRDEYQIKLPVDIAAGEYRLQVGMYELQSGRRLQAQDMAGVPIGDAIELSSKVTVQR